MLLNDFQSWEGSELFRDETSLSFITTLTTPVASSTPNLPSGGNGGASGSGGNSGMNAGGNTNTGNAGGNAMSGSGGGAGGQGNVSSRNRKITLSTTMSSMMMTQNTPPTSGSSPSAGMNDLSVSGNNSNTLSMRDVSTNGVTGGQGAANNANINNNNNNDTFGNTPVDPNTIKWQTEIERGFEALVAVIYPYISDVKEAELFATSSHGHHHHQHHTTPPAPPGGYAGNQAVFS